MQNGNYIDLIDYATHAFYGIDALRPPLMITWGTAKDAAMLAELAQDDKAEKERNEPTTNGLTPLKRFRTRMENRCPSPLYNLVNQRLQQKADTPRYYFSAPIIRALASQARYDSRRQSQS